MLVVSRGADLAVADGEAEFEEKEFFEYQTGVKGSPLLIEGRKVCVVVRKVHAAHGLSQGGQPVGAADRFRQRLLDQRREALHGIVHQVPHALLGQPGGEGINRHQAAEVNQLGIVGFQHFEVGMDGFAAAVVTVEGDDAVADYARADGKALLQGKAAVLEPLAGKRRAGILQAQGSKRPAA